ncbi:DUF4259 domain-containing protein [Nocardia sp. NPDC050175]|uniref:DUF4259 domain-containing protein n=1 Tax=Nocardia sp. NPDC050175 TaxID=3364317 RepID=UPI0037B1413B
MGNWGHGAFDDDSALDYLDGLVDSGRDVTERFRELLNSAVSTDYLEYFVSVPALAVVALIADRQQPGLITDTSGREYARDLDFGANEDLHALAVRALDRILDPQDNHWYGIVTADGPLPEEARAEFDRYRAALS